MKVCIQPGSGVHNNIDNIDNTQRIRSIILIVITIIMIIIRESRMYRGLFAIRGV